MAACSEFAVGGVLGVGDGEGGDVDVGGQGVGGEDVGGEETEVVV